MSHARQAARQVTVHFRQCDPAGILFFAEIFTMAHDELENLLSRQGIKYREWFENSEFAMPIISSKSDFKSPMKAGEIYDVTSQVSKVGNSSINFNFSFSDNLRTCADVNLTCVFVEKSTNKSISVPDKFRELLDQSTSR